ncbi:VCBS repeat-containing protein [candidate division WOR-3 bacterium]|nr:VCBS repeat-containing protein [candidate division WOR-3 bacterium]
MMQGVLTLVILAQLFNPLDVFEQGDCHGVCCTDFDTDGNYDVIMASDTGVYFYKNTRTDGNLSFADPIVISGANTARAVLAANLDTDEDVDIFVATSVGDFLMQTTDDNPDDPKFERKDWFHSDQSFAAAFVDYDEDGDLDIFVAGDSSRLYQNDGNAVFSVAGIIERRGYAVSIADHNGDGVLDLALAVDDSVILYRVLSTGQFERDISFEAVSPRGLRWFSNGPDSLLDLVVADSAGVNFWIEHTESGFTPHDIDILVEPTMAVATGDFDSLPGQDILFVNYGSPDRIYIGPDFVSQDSVSFGTDQGRSVALADLDGNNGMDAVVVGAGSNAVYENTVPRDDHYVIRLSGRRDLASNLSNKIAVGARITLYDSADTIKGLWEIAAGSGHAGQDAPQIGFAITDPADHILAIYWPRSGVVDSFVVGTLKNYVEIEEDMTSPEPPQELKSPTHNDTNKWYNNPEITLTWEPGFDPHGSGLAGYSYMWSNDSSTIPDMNVQIDDTTLTQLTLTIPNACQGNNCYFHMASVDRVGNVSIPERVGPLKLDFQRPRDIEQVIPSLDTFINDTFILYQWRKGHDPDPGSGIKEYRIETASRPDFFPGPDYTFTVPSDSNSFRSSDTLDETRYWWRIITSDFAGNKDTVPQQDGESLGVPFNIDVTPPQVNEIFPTEDDTVATTTQIYITFSEEMLPASATNPNNYRIIQRDSLRTISAVNPHPIIEYRYKIELKEELAETTRTDVQVLTSVTDLAGNGLDSTYSSYFMTSEVSDTAGPRITLVSSNPNPTEGAEEVAMRVRATDVGYGGSVVQDCIYFIDGNYTEIYHMEPENDFPDSIKFFVETVYTDSLGLGTHTFTFQARDQSDNLGPDTSEVLEVTAGTGLDIDVDVSGKDALPSGDTLKIKITTNTPLTSLFLTFDSEGEPLDVPPISVQPPPQDTATQKICLSSGFPKGKIRGKAIGEDKDHRTDEDTFSFTITSVEILPPERAYAAPNPASDSVGIYFVPGEDVTSTLRIFTIDGQEVWAPDPIQDAPGGIRSVFSCDVSDWPVGLYLFVIQVSNDKGQRSTVRKAFAVLR